MTRASGCWEQEPQSWGQLEQVSPPLQTPLPQLRASLILPVASLTPRSMTPSLQSSMEITRAAGMMRHRRKRGCVYHMVVFWLQDEDREHVRNSSWLQVNSGEGLGVGYLRWGIHPPWGRDYGWRVS